MSPGGSRDGVMRAWGHRTERTGRARSVRVGILALLALLPLLALLLGAPAQARGRASRPRLDVRLLARVGPPGFPALSLVAPDGTIYAGTFAGPSCCTGASKVFHYDLSGRLLATSTVIGQDPGALNGVQVANRDDRGRLYLLDQHPPRALTLDPRTGAQTSYATFSDVPSCPATGRAGCSQTLVDNEPEPNYAAWGPDGSLYVTDFTQALVWRVPPGGGPATVWLSDPRLDGAQFGPTGIVLLPDHRTLLLAVAAGRPGSGGAPGTGGLYTLPITSTGAPGPLRQVWQSGAREAPDGFAVARSGHVYLALVGPAANAVVELSADGTELARIPAGPTGNATMPVPFDGPSSVQFDGEDVIVTNDAFFTGDASHFALFDVYVAEPGLPVYVPAGAGLAASAGPAAGAAASGGASGPAAAGSPAGVGASTARVDSLAATGANGLVPLGAVVVLLGGCGAARSARTRRRRSR